jgi:hypothetical protein
MQVEELRQRLEEKNRHIEKKTLTATQATQERNRLNNELNELRDHMDIKDRKINVLQRKVGPLSSWFPYLCLFSKWLFQFPIIQYFYILRKCYCRVYDVFFRVSLFVDGGRFLHCKSDFCSGSLYS